MKASNGIQASLIPGQSISGTIEVKNLSPVALTNVRAAVGSLPPSVLLTLGDAQSLAGDGTILIPYTITGRAGLARSRRRRAHHDHERPRRDRVHATPGCR